MKDVSFIDMIMIIWILKFDFLHPFIGYRFELKEIERKVKNQTKRT